MTSFKFSICDSWSKQLLISQQKKRKSYLGKKPQLQIAMFYEILSEKINIKIAFLLVFYSVCALTLASSVMASSVDKQFEKSSNEFAAELYQVKIKILKMFKNFTILINF